jgi:NodT family efflux transporter outer membrane factor (OMF) lipoprotein
MLEAARSNVPRKVLRGKRPSRARFCLAASLLGLSCCAVGPRFVRPPAPGVAHYVAGAEPSATPAASGLTQRFTPGGALSADWWRLFKSPALEAVVLEALRNNPGLDAARASLAASEDELRAGYGIFFPQAKLDASATRERFSPLMFGGAGASSLFNLFTLSAQVSYALDIFGGNRRALEALAAQSDVQRANEQATYLTLVSNIVNTLVARAAYAAEVEATQQLIELQLEQVRLAEVRTQAGTAPYSNVLSLESQLASYRATIPQLEQKLAQSEDLLATLAGHAPAEWRAPQIGLTDLELPRDLPVSVPSALVRQRPDILAAEATAHAASAEIGVATAALLPSVTLTGSYAANGTTTGHLLDSKGRTWSAGADIAAPLFEGGTLWYKRKAAVDLYRQATASYRQTVITAFGQVADTLHALDNDAAALAAQDEALSSADQALHLVETNYEAGLATYLDVLNADSQYHEARINELEATALRYQDTVALYVALGGGWWNRCARPGDCQPLAAR